MCGADPVAPSNGAHHPLAAACRLHGVGESIDRRRRRSWRESFAPSSSFKVLKSLLLPRTYLGLLASGLRRRRFYFRWGVKNIITKVLDLFHHPLCLPLLITIGVSRRSFESVCHTLDNSSRARDDFTRRIRMRRDGWQKWRKRGGKIPPSASV